MKTMTFKEFLHEPKGTIFTEYVDHATVYSPYILYEALLDDDGDGGNFYYYSFLVECENSGNFEQVGNDSIFGWGRDYKQLFLVYDDTDVDMMIKILNERKQPDAI